MRGARAQACDGVSALVAAWAGQSWRSEGGHGGVERAASVLAGGGRATPLGEEAVEHRDADPVAPVQGARARDALLVRGVYGHNGHHRARAQAKTALAQPEQAVAQGGLAQRHARKPAGRWGADTGLS